MINTYNRKGSVALVLALIVVIVLAAVGGIWYYETHNSPATQSTSQNTTTATNSTAPNMTAVQTTSTEATTSTSTTTQMPTSNNTPVVSQPSAAVSTGWSQGRFSFTAPITGCFAFNYPPTFSNPVGDSASDNNGNTFDYSVDLTQNINFQEVEEFSKSQGFTEKDFTTTGGFAGKEFFLKNRDTLFDIFVTGSQQIMIGLDFGHDPRVPSPSLALSTEEAIAQSVVFPCPSQ